MPLSVGCDCGVAGAADELCGRRSKMLDPADLFVAETAIRRVQAEHAGQRVAPNKGPRAPDARDAVYANRRRICGPRGKALLRQRSVRLERPNAHLYEAGGIRRIHLRGHANILKRLLVGAYNLGLYMRQRCSVGIPRSLQDGPGLWRLYSHTSGPGSLSGGSAH